jgi:PAS domain S-box-containing protein
MIPAPKPNNEKGRLKALRRYDILDTPPEQAYDDLVALAAEITGAPVAFIALIDSKRQWFKAKHGISLTESPRETSFCGHAIMDGALFEVPDASNDERFHDNPWVTGQTNIRFYAGQALSTPDGHRIGTLCVIDQVPRALTPPQRSSLEALARQVMANLELRRISRSAQALDHDMQAVIDNAPFNIVLKDLAGRYVRVNRHWQEYFGLEAVAAIGRRFDEIGGRAEHSEIAAQEAALLRDGEVAPIEIDVAVQNGVRSLQIYKFALTDENGTPTMLCGMDVDITALKAAEQDRLNVARRYRALFEASIDAIVVLDQNGGVVEANASFAKMLGYTPSEAFKLSVFDWDVKWSRDELLRGLAELAQENRIFETRHRRKDGTVIDVEVSSSNIALRGGTFIFSVQRDVSARKAAERAITRARDLLQSIQAIQNSFVAGGEARPAFAQMLSVLLAFTESKYGFAGDVLRRVDGAPYLKLRMVKSVAAEEEGAGFFRSVPEVEPELSNSNSLIGMAIMTGRTVVANDPGSDPRRSGLPLGHPALSTFLGLPVQINGQVVAMIGLANRPEGYDDGIVAELQPLLSTFGSLVLGWRNIEERRFAEMTLKRLNEDLEQRVIERTNALQQAQKMEAIGQLTGGIAHDFNNMLAVIGGSLELIMRLEEVTPRQANLIRQALDGTERAAELTRTLLAYARRQTLRPELTNVNTLITAFVPMLKRTLGEATEITLKLAPDIEQTQIDRHQMQSAILNLTINARDAMPQGGRLTITTENFVLDEAIRPLIKDLDPGPYVRVVVSDTGIGMKKEILDRAFEPFFTTKEVGKGSGLGLSMIFGFAKQSGGTARIYSEPGKGTSVSLYLPRAEGAMTGKTETAEPEPAESKGRGERILLVEDNRVVAETILKMLTHFGYSPHLATDGASALSYLSSPADVALVVTDVIMPGGMDGFALARQALAKRPGLPIIFMSGFTDRSVMPDDFSGPDVILLNKPFRAAQLVAAIKQTLDQKKHLR